MTAPLITLIVNLGGCCGRTRPFMAPWREIIWLLSKGVSARNQGSRSLYAPHYYSHLDDDDDHHHHNSQQGVANEDLFMKLLESERKSGTQVVGGRYKSCENSHVHGDMR